MCFTSKFEGVKLG